MSIALYAQQVLDYLYDNGFEYADQDPRGPVFSGGILMELGGGQKVAFILPDYDLDVALNNLGGHLETIYPQGHTLDPTGPVRERGIIRIHVRLNTADLALAG